ncbi:hypothetical protein GJ496_005526 [Pomphorhynchus laevis]|nr:hypothetical protein GJ496_005526 [Pomphorhynchus laevis]
MNRQPEKATNRKKSDRNDYERKQSKDKRADDEGNNSASQAASSSGNMRDANKQRKFREKHHPILRAIWDVNKDEINTAEKLRKLEDVIVKQRNDVSTLCDVLDDITGKPIAQATPLIIACFEGDLDVIKFIIEAGADTNQTESEHHLTPIHVLCDAEYQGQCLRQKDRADLVKLLIKRGAKVNHLDRNAMTAIHKAVIHDRPECVQVLMDAKADPNVIYLGDTPLSIAARHNRTRICQILLKYHETNVNHKNDQGGTPLHFASAAIVDSPECIELLLASGARVNAVDIRRNTATMVSTFFSKPTILSTLIRAGGDLSMQNNEGRTALDIAKEKEHDECAAIITKYSNKGSTRREDRDKLADDMDRMKIRK